MDHYLSSVPSVYKVLLLDKYIHIFLLLFGGHISYTNLSLLKMKDKPRRGEEEASKENWRPMPSLYEGPLTSPFAMGRGTVTPAAQQQRRGLQNCSRGIHSQHAHESALLQNGYGSNGVIPSQGGNELKNPFGRGRGMLPPANQHSGGSGGTPPPPPLGGVAMPRENMVTGSNGTTGVGRGFSQLRIQ